jgi:uncharacterized protein
MSVADEIRKLDILRQSGAITEEEFERAKQSLLAPSTASPLDVLEEYGKRDSFWAGLLHLSLFLGYLIPVAGLVAPVIIWQTKKKSPVIDRHGRAVMNWLISHLIWLLVSALLCFVLVGIPMLWILGIIAIIFPIIGAMRAFDGEFWSYPLCIRFFKEV